MADENPAVVIDCGTGTCRAGFAGDKEPLAVFPSVIGRLETDGDKKKIYVGEELENHPSTTSMSKGFPIEFSYVKNWDYMEGVWRYVYDSELEVSPEDQPVLISEPPMNPKINREKTTEIMFESLNVPSMFLAKEAVMAMYDAGEVTGTVLQSGDGFTFAIPIYEGSSIPSATIKLPLAGRELTQHLKNLLQSTHPDQIQNFSDHSEIQTMKETMCYVAEDFNQELKKSADSLQSSHVMSNGDSVKLGFERVKCPEALFDPRLYGQEFGGIHEFLVNSIQRCDPDIQNDMYRNIVLSGGNTMFPGLVPRLQKEVSALLPEVEVRIMDTADRDVSAWRGGSVMASALTSLFIQKTDYDEHGPTIVHRKCYF